MKKSTAGIALLVCAGLMWVLGSQNWGAEVGAPADLPAGVSRIGDTASRGQPVLTALAAVSAVASVLFFLVGKAGRWVVAGLYAAGGLAFALIAATTSGAGNLRWLGLALGVCAAGVALYVARASATWATSSKYDRDTGGDDSAGQPDAVSDWDTLSRGEDPS